MILPKITVIVPSFNQGLYLEETILSIINQDYPNLELFVVDGGSTDNSVEIIKKYEDKITWWVSEKDRGQSAAINKGLARATGDIISWLCSDDLYTPGTLLAVADYFSQQPRDVGLIHGGTILFNSKKEISTEWGYFPPSVERNLAGMAFSQPSAFFLKKYLDRAGNSLREELHYGMDYDLFCRLACLCRFLPVKNIFSRYRLHSQSKSMAEQHHFISDWNKVFINFCKNAGWQHELNDLISSGLFPEEVLSYYYPYSFAADAEITRRADKKNILFYHYCYTLKAWYRSGELEKAKQLAAVIRRKYPALWWQHEPGISAIMNRLKWPAALIRALRKIRN
jgi:glycosyltransferase involved in cell wall biosynthesis